MFSNEDKFEDDRNIIETFIERSSQTLEVFDIPESYTVESKDLQSLLASCKNLKRYCAFNTKDGDVALTFQDVVSKEWACLDLKELCIQLTRRDRRLGPSGENEDGLIILESEELSKMAKLVYGQIGRLSKLEGLAIGHDQDEDWDEIEEIFQNDLTLKNGWLSELSGLKELKHFQMMTDFWTGMGQAEVEFMHENWPRLERLKKITFGIGWASFTNHIWEQPHWQWLKSQRPTLEFGYDYDDPESLVDRAS
ncbi:hypothetical protein BGX27_005823 [Mortierella sp. AM989]|nr:hypothetical protein BGX27_005823 [Mortierella sp. AM989]